MRESSVSSLLNNDTKYQWTGLRIDHASSVHPAGHAQFEARDCNKKKLVSAQSLYLLVQVMRKSACKSIADNPSKIEVAYDYDI